MSFFKLLLVLLSLPPSPCLPLCSNPPINIAVIRINLVCLDSPRQGIDSEDRCVCTFLSMIKWNQHSFWHPGTQAFSFWDGSIRIIFCFECHSWLLLICVQTTISLWISKWTTSYIVLSKQRERNHLEFTLALIRHSDTFRRSTPGTRSHTSSQDNWVGPQK